MTSQPDSPSPSNADQPRQNLQALRQSILDLHKTLIDSEKVGYEQTFGPIESQNKFLQLLISDPWFAWLHPLSELVVVMDETLDGEEPVTAEIVKRFAAETKALLKASEEGEGFERSYFEALQREPDVVMAHAEVAKRLNVN
ncbi:hypothetical protein [Pedosphaera parvula]|uniref:Uncharacterized protein n=1 Tax=Pedosphaera parvula (strain Ellin514) TaxID=320771 RepID=B9XCR4_PEDPL|nr:hypothetical protein [Pedosphaera parvula]EEF62260.1 conserved hypothetical protein [Pedosphaera parvula Ellin514]